MIFFAPSSSVRQADARPDCGPSPQSASCLLLILLTLSDNWTLAIFERGMG